MEGTLVPIEMRSSDPLVKGGWQIFEGYFLATGGFGRGSQRVMPLLSVTCDHLEYSVTQIFQIY